ncbi:MAG: hypothetical protein HKN94_14780 [Acidimicrobiales bacterium]|nr:hypothetical protein [Acidimicrobiales bacterium]
MTQSTRWVRPDSAPDVGNTLPPVEEPPVTETRRSRQAMSDIRSMLLVSGSIGTALLLLVGALVLINQAGATDEDNSPTGVSFTLDSIADRQNARVARADERAPSAQVAVGTLVDATPGLAPAFVDDAWPDGPTGCDDPLAVALANRSAAPIDWVNQRTCTARSGNWRDRYHDVRLTAASDMAVSSLIPLKIVHESGGWEWDKETRAAFVADVFAPSVTITTRDAGHNPNRQSPDQWRPAREETWCAYAVDWVEVKARWNLGVTTAERGALTQMLATCDDASSEGADPDTVELQPPDSPTIALT